MCCALIPTRTESAKLPSLGPRARLQVGRIVVPVVVDARTKLLHGGGINFANSCIVIKICAILVGNFAQPPFARKIQSEKCDKFNSSQNDKRVGQTLREADERKSFFFHPGAVEGKRRKGGSAELDFHCAIHYKLNHHLFAISSRHIRGNHHPSMGCMKRV